MREKQSALTPEGESGVGRILFGTRKGVAAFGGLCFVTRSSAEGEDAALKCFMS